MPNWVYNNLRVEGSEADVARLKEQVGKHYTQMGTSWESGALELKEFENTDEFSFWNIIRPAGDDLTKYEESLTTGGVSPFWYDWNNRFWGVKWDASEVRMDEISDTIVIYSFSTPWGVPNPVLSALAEQYPDVVLTNEWEEEQGFGGTLQYSGSGIEVLDEYDIPNSHAENMERKDYCWACEEAPEDQYPDCPGYANDVRIPEDELEVETAARF